MSNEAMPGQGNQNEGQEDKRLTRRKVLQGGAILGGMAVASAVDPKMVKKLMDPATADREARNEKIGDLTKFRLEMRDRVYRIGEQRNRVGGTETVIDNLFKKTRGDSTKATDQMITDEFTIVDKQ